MVKDHIIMIIETNDNTLLSLFQSQQWATVKPIPEVIEQLWFEFDFVPCCSQTPKPSNLHLSLCLRSYQLQTPASTAEIMWITRKNMSRPHFTTKLHFVERKLTCCQIIKIFFLHCDIISNGSEAHFPSKLLIVILPDLLLFHLFVVTTIVSGDFH